MAKRSLKKLLGLDDDWSYAKGGCDDHEEFVKALKKASKLGLIDLDDNGRRLR